MKGIYKITSPSNKIYIGKSTNIKNRFIQYKNMNCRSQDKLYKSFVGHGVDKHKFTIIHELPKDISDAVLNEYELLYYDLYKSSNHEMLNLVIPGIIPTHHLETKIKISSSLKKHKVSSDTIKKIVESRKWYRHSEETKIKMRNKHSGIKKSDTHKLNIAKKINQYSIEGVLERTWDSAMAASLSLGIDNSIIGKCARGERKTAGGFLWKFV